MNCEEGEQTDHINHNCLDNRISNLRKCNSSQNNCNKPPRIVTSKYKGVGWNKEMKKWRSRIRINNKEYYLGHFDCEIEAAKAYDTKALELHGEFAYTNF